MDINGAIRAIALEVAGSAEFAALKRSKEALSASPAKEKRLIDFLTKQNRLNTGQTSPSEAESLMAELQSEYAALGAVPEITGYFTASEAFNQLLGAIMRQLHGAIDDLLSK